MPFASEPEPNQATSPQTDPEQAVRQLWDAQGVAKERQEEILAEVTAKVLPGAQVGPFRLREA